MPTRAFYRDRLRRDRGRSGARHAPGADVGAHEPVLLERPPDRVLLRLAALRDVGEAEHGGFDGRAGVVVEGLASRDGVRAGHLAVELLRGPIASSRAKAPGVHALEGGREPLCGLVRVLEACAL